MKNWAFVFVVVLVSLGTTGSARAYIHVARDGETLEQLASFYYGNPKKAIVIRAANGFMHPDDGTVLQGERVEIPAITYHQVKTGEDWYTLANQFLGSSKRAKFLAQLNEQSVETSLSSGRIVRIPYQLLYIFAPDESLKSITRQFLGKRRTPGWLRDYNLKKRRRYGRGDAILIPLMDLAFTEVAKAQIDDEQVTRTSRDDAARQKEVTAQIANLRAAYQNGRYLEIVATGNALLSHEWLTNPQKIGVYKYMAFAYMAFDETDLAQQAFFSALELQPAMELSPITVSPKIMVVFSRAKAKLESKQAVNE